MLFNIWLRFARIDSSRRWDIFRRCFDWQHWNISYKRQSFHHYPNPPQFLKKSWDQSHREIYIKDVFTSGGFSYSFGEEGRAVNGALLTSQSLLSRSYAFLWKWILDFFNFIFYLQSKAKHVTFTCLEAGTRAKKNWAVATFSQAIHEQRQQTKIVCNSTSSSRP